MKVNPKSKRKDKPFYDLAPGDLFRRPGSEAILMKLFKLSNYPFNSVNLIDGYTTCVSEMGDVIPIEGEFIEK